MADRLSNPSWPNRSGDLVVPFVFIPDGVPEPSEWPFSLTNAVRMRAMFVPDRDDGARGHRRAPSTTIAWDDAGDAVTVFAGEVAATPETWGAERRPAADDWPADGPAAPAGSGGQPNAGQKVAASDTPAGANRNGRSVMPGNAAPGDRPRGVSPPAGSGEGSGPHAPGLVAYPVAAKDNQTATTGSASPQPGWETVDLSNDGGTVGALGYLGSHVYRNLLQQPLSDMRDLLNNPDQIAGALAGVLPGFAPGFGDVPQAVSRAIAALRALDKVQGSPPSNVFSPESLSEGHSWVRR